MPPSEPFSLSADPQELLDAVTRAQADAGLMAELAEIYAALDADIAAIEPVCWGSGACCRFDQAGHRLYVSTVELAYLLACGPAVEPTRLGRCAYQHGPRCLNRTGRPIGCRIYFCRKDLQEPLAELYAKYHRQIRQLHSRISLVYHYVEISGALAALAELKRR